jgi:hypothetical protein
MVSPVETENKKQLHRILSLSVPVCWHAFNACSCASGINTKSGRHCLTALCCLKNQVRNRKLHVPRGKQQLSVLNEPSRILSHEKHPGQSNWSSNWWKRSCNLCLVSFVFPFHVPAVCIWYLCLVMAIDSIDRWTKNRKSASKPCRQCMNHFSIFLQQQVPQLAKAGVFHLYDPRLSRGLLSSGPMRYPPTPGRGHSRPDRQHWQGSVAESIFKWHPTHSTIS